MFPASVKLENIIFYSGSDFLNFLAVLCKWVTGTLVFLFGNKFVKGLQDSDHLFSVGDQDTLNYLVLLTLQSKNIVVGLFFLIYNLLPLIFFNSKQR
jgi:hypothetical protein